MPTATCHPCCPRRVATPRPLRWLMILAFGLLGTTTATVSASGEKIDYRFSGPTLRAQPRTAEAAPVLYQKTTLQKTTPRLAAQWRTNLPGQSGVQPVGNGPELLAVPKEATKAKKKKTRKKRPFKKKNSKQKKKPRSQPHVCYRAPSLSSLSTQIGLPSGKLPTDAAAKCAVENPPTSDLRLAGAWTTTEQHWSATCLHHRPLYFEEINAERHGYTPSYLLQPLISAGHFFVTIPALPYKMAVDHPRDCVYTLGHYRPGSGCTPWRGNRLPLRLKGVAAETAFIAGMILLLP